MLTTKRALTQAARLSNKIKALQEQLSEVISTAKTIKTPKAGARPRKRREGPTIASQIIDILKKSRKALKAREIYERLVNAGVDFDSANPVVSVSTRLYKLPGVKKTKEGLFAFDRLAKAQ